MSVGITLEELLAWNEQSANYWNTHLDTNLALLDLPCDIGGTANVRGFVRHIWGAELRWGQRLAGLPVAAREALPAGPLEALFEIHRQAVEIFRDLLAAPEESWSAPFILEFDWVPRKSAPSPGERSRCMRSFIASVTGRNWQHWSVLRDFLPNSGATCSSVRRCASSPPELEAYPAASGSTHGKARVCPASA